MDLTPRIMKLAINHKNQPENPTPNFIFSLQGFSGQFLCLLANFIVLGVKSIHCKCAESTEMVSEGINLI